MTEGKTAKNRCHAALAADDRESVAREVDRLVALGATVIRQPQEEFGHYWATLHDPEENELCIGTPQGADSTQGGRAGVGWRFCIGAA